MGDAQHGAGHQALQGRRAVRGSDQTPVGSLVAALQDLHRLAAADRQLVAVAGHEVVNDHGELAASRQLRRRRRSSARFRHCVKWITNMCVCVFAYLVAIQCVLRGAGCQRDGVWLAAAFALTIQIFSIPDHHTHTYTELAGEAGGLIKAALCSTPKCLPSPFVMLGCSRFGDVNGLLERPPQVNGALLDHLPDVFDPVLLVLDARGLGREWDRGQVLQGDNAPLEFLVGVFFCLFVCFHSVFTQV